MKILIFSVYDGFYNFTLSEIVNGKYRVIESANKCFDEDRCKYDLDLCDISYLEIEKLKNIYPGYDLYIMCQDGSINFYINEMEKRNEN